jgi:hypothetical protein
MHPDVVNFRNRWPRVYGLIDLGVALAAAGWARHTLLQPVAFLLLLLSAAYGVAGILYLALGAKCNEWDARFSSSFDPDRLSWGQVGLLIGLGSSLFALALLLHRLLNIGCGRPIRYSPIRATALLRRLLSFVGAGMSECQKGGQSDALLK